MATDFSKEENAETYLEGIEAEELSLKPVIIDSLGDLVGKTVLDLGCGSGKWSSYLVEQGAEVVGIDIAPAQIELAKEQDKENKISYIVGDISDLPDKYLGRLDLVFMNMVLPDLAGPDESKKLQNLMVNIETVLKEGGRLIFTYMHPLYLYPNLDDLDHSVDFDPKQYFDEGSTYKAQAATKQGNTIDFTETHFSLGFIAQTIKEAELKIESLRESLPVPERNIYLPKYILFECVK